MSYLFTSESVSEGHPDKVADQISDCLLDEYLKKDPDAKVAIETMVTTQKVIIAGEVRSTFRIDPEKHIRDLIRKIGYTDPKLGFSGEEVEIINLIHDQSDNINQAVERDKPHEQGAGDQGIMFGFACNQTESYMPVPNELSHRILRILAEIRREGKEMLYLQPDSKAQFTVEYTGDKAERVDTILVSTQHDKLDQDQDALISQDFKRIVIPRLIDSLPDKLAELFKGDYKLIINPSAQFIKGGPDADTGLTGRKIIADTYGGWSRHGGGAFSGKDPSKVDRSAAYMARHIAKSLVSSGLLVSLEIQLGYAIGKHEPVSVNINTFGTEKTGWSERKLEKLVRCTFPLTPFGIIKYLGLKNPIYLPTATYGHFGRKPYTEDNHEFFPWEKTVEVGSFKDHGPGIILTGITDKEDKYGYIARFGKMDLEELVESFNGQVGNTGWASAKGHYLAALYAEFRARGINLSEIGSKSNFSMRNEVIVIEGRLVVKP